MNVVESRYHDDIQQFVPTSRYDHYCGLVMSIDLYLGFLFWWRRGGEHVSWCCLCCDMKGKLVIGYYYECVTAEVII
jgi:hypothetical protein